MDLRISLNKNQSKIKLLQMADYVGNNRSRFKLLIDIYLAGPYRITQRASYPLTSCALRHPKLIRPYLNRLVAHLEKPGTFNSLKRNTIRLFQWVSIPPSLRGKVLDICFKFLQDKNESIAVKVFSMSVINKLAAGEADILRELKIILEDQLPYSRAAFKSRAGKILKSIAVSVRKDQAT